MVKVLPSPVISVKESTLSNVVEELSGNFPKLIRTLCDVLV